jgi:hypothetical protein
MTSASERLIEATGRLLAATKPQQARLSFVFNAALVLGTAALGHLKGEGLGWFDGVAALVAAANLGLYGYRSWRSRQWKRRLHAWQASVQAFRSSRS